ncbi:hypothetical protein BB559_003933 [Furculomyces boomerangus]|uniref:Ribosome assembly protein 1 n=1 Tax=Furculomyces boomerangus TaxID=61424 RepID=A0A2T9YHR3_9FUNG|nr:hypothetical protein BB559_004064 [Furculomyces boomerangus]PVU91892.1 hypothetical protein BB559_003933 [Furculomyces boomerangus]
MTTVPLTKLIELQKNTNDIRNVCVLAHVDHGKTTLTDSLLSTNGIISTRLAGKVRYLDSREDEQQRGITMESSGISLYFKILKNKILSPKAEENLSPKDPQTTSLDESEYLINLIDSPGHIDFGSEVSSASRISDGALVLVDAVEGVCTQTINVLRQAWLEKIKSVLVINKIDRLITELQMTASEAYTHMQQLIEQVNAVLAGFWESDRIEENENRITKKDKVLDSDQKVKGVTNKLGSLSISANDWYLEEKDDSHIYFSPEIGNVIFCSATDGWAFRINDFASFISQKMGLGTPEKLQQVLWGDYYLDPKNRKRVLTKKQLVKLYGDNNKTNSTLSNLQPLFVQLCLTSIWKVYDSIIISPDQTKIDKIIETIGAKIHPRDRKVKEPKTLLGLVMRSWMPVAQACMLAIIDQLPSPIQAQAIRVPSLLKGSKNINSGPIVEAMLKCTCDENGPSVAYISKVLAMEKSKLPENLTKPERLRLTADEMRAQGRSRIATPTISEKEPSTSETSTPGPENTPQIREDESSNSKSKEVLIGFGRLYCGILKVGDPVWMLSPRFKPKRPNANHYSQTVITSLYIFMGSELLPVQKVFPGCVFGIRSIDGETMISGTLTTQFEECPNLSSLHSQSAPIVRVAIEPANPADINKLNAGLSLLRNSDASVRVDHNSSGEYVLVTAGELHLERCLKDLRERYAKCELQVSKPQVPFRETIVYAPGQPGAYEILLGSNYGLLSVSGGLKSSISKANSPDMNTKGYSESTNSPNPSTIENGEYGSPTRQIPESGSSATRGRITVSTPNKMVSVTLTVQPMPQNLVKYLTGIKSKIPHILHITKKSPQEQIDSSSLLPEENKISTHTKEGLVGDDVGIEKEDDAKIVSPDIDENSKPISKPADIPVEPELSSDLEFGSDIDSVSSSSNSDGFSSSSSPSPFLSRVNSKLNFTGSNSPVSYSPLKLDVNKLNTEIPLSSDGRTGTNTPQQFKSTSRSRKNKNISFEKLAKRINYLIRKNKNWDKKLNEIKTENIWSFGPNYVGANILLKENKSCIDIYGNKTYLTDINYQHHNKKTEKRHELPSENVSIPDKVDQNDILENQDLSNTQIQIETEQKSKSRTSLRNDIQQAVLTGFQLATASGPLCSEPVVGLVCTIHNISVNPLSETDSNSTSLQQSTIVGQLIPTVRDAIKQAMLMWSCRLMLAMYDCDIQASSDVLGKMYGVLSKRRGQITSEDMQEGTPYFRVKASIPAVESFGFADEMRKRTSGAAQPLLVFKGYEMLDIDPFWVPSTKEELEDLGEKADRENIARVYMDTVRRRKGLSVEKKIIGSAEKQRTLKK